MPDLIGAPAARPCGSCPYRRDVPSGVWDASEYENLPAYDAETWAQPPSVFLCHQRDGRVCAGWAGCHDMDESFGLRLAAASGFMAPEDVEATLDYRTDVPLFGSGEEAAEHGLLDLEDPPPAARDLVRRLSSRRAR